MSRSRDKSGHFIKTDNWKQDMAKRSEDAKNMHGMSGLKKPSDYAEALINVTESAMAKTGTKRSEKAFKQLENTINARLQTDFAEIYSPSQNFFSEDASGGDDYSEGGRTPLIELVAMTQYRAGWAYRATYGWARDLYRNGYEFVPEAFDIDTKEKPQPEIKKWMDQVDFFSFRIQHSFRERQTGLGIGIPIWKGETAEELGLELDLSKKKDRPYKLKAYSAWHLAPANVLQYELGDYDKSKWDFRGGITSTLFNHSRITLLETKPEPFHLRGLAVIEPIWAPSLCYFNLMIFLMKSLAQVGTLSVGVKTASEYPTKKETANILEMLNDFRANKFYVLGAGSELITQNMASQFGKGIGEFAEFLKEDISGCLVIPKNQLFGRAEGGGLDGAGALVSKDDMLSALMADAQDMTSEELAFLRGPCKFEKHLEGLTLRWKLDLHKTEMERLEEDAKRLQMKMMRLEFEQAEKQAKFNMKLMDYQQKEFDKNPQRFLEQTETEGEKDVEKETGSKMEGNKINKPKVKDFMQYYRPLKVGGLFTKPKRKDEEL